MLTQRLENEQHASCPNAPERYIPQRSRRRTAAECFDLSVNTDLTATAGISVRHGLSVTVCFETKPRRIVTSQCGNIILMADHTKFDREALITYCPLEKVSTVVTDIRPGDSYMDFFKEHGIRVLYGV